MALLNNSPFPIIISGTGPAALLFAHSLLRSVPSIPFRLYERDLSINYRAQGYRFRITGRGVKSCRDNLSPEHFALLRATCGDNSASTGPKLINPITGTLVPNLMPPPGKAGDEQPMTADRTIMRQVLFKGLEPYTTFGKEIVEYEEIADLGNGSSTTENDPAPAIPGIKVRFSDGSSDDASLLVAADGAFSRIRSQLSPSTPLLDTQLRMIFGKTPLTSTFTSTFPSLFLDGAHLLTDPSPHKDAPRFFMFEPMCFSRRAEAETADPAVAKITPDDYVYWALALRSDRPEADGVKWGDLTPEQAADFAILLAEAEGWSSELQALVQMQDREQTAPLKSGVIPVPISGWRSEGESDPMVTMIGDAAHAVPPTGGIGATMALTDAAVLAGKLSEFGISRRALGEYEREMRAYAGEGIERSVKYGRMLVGMRTQEEMEVMER